VRRGCQDCFAALSGELLQVEGYDFSCVSVKSGAEFVEDPPLFLGLKQFGYAVTVFLTVA